MAMLIFAYARHGALISRILMGNARRWLFDEDTRAGVTRLSTEALFIA